MLDHQLYLPKEWAQDRRRRKKARVPQQVRFETKPQLAAELIRRTVANGHVRFDWIVADDHYGQNGGFLDALETAGHRRRHAAAMAEGASGGLGRPSVERGGLAR